MTDRPGRIVRYAVVPEHPLWETVRSVVRASVEPADLVRDALRDVPGIEAAFLFRSAAAGTS